MLAVVKEEGLKFFSGARAGRSLKAEEKEAKVQKKSRRGTWNEVAGFSCNAELHVKAMIDEEARSSSCRPALCSTDSGWMLHYGLSLVPKVFPSFSACWKGTIPAALPQLPPFLQPCKLKSILLL